MNDEKRITNDYSQRPRMMPVHSPILQVRQNLRDAEKRIEELTKERDDLREMVAMENEKLARMVDATMQRRAENAEAQYTTLLTWSQAAYKRLGGLMTIGVSMTPDAVTARLLSDAPANVSAEVDPFSATVDSVYSIYTDPLIVGIAKSMECTIDDLVEYAYESVGYPKDDAE